MPNLFSFNTPLGACDTCHGFGRTIGVDMDLVIPDMEYIRRNKDRVAGVVLTHAHEDHIGAIPYLADELKVPLYATPFTAAVLRRQLSRLPAELMAAVDRAERAEEIDVEQYGAFASPALGSLQDSPVSSASQSA
mgnify:CR=1 FL=1